MRNQSSASPRNRTVTSRQLLGLILFVLADVAIIIWLYRHQLERRSPGPGVGAAQNVAISDLPEIKFTDVTKESGITFAHFNGAYGGKLLPETMGGGVAFLDYDNDGDSDLLFVNGSVWRHQPGVNSNPHTSTLYQNDGRGRFTDVTAGSGLDVSNYGMGVAAGDYDSDGKVDIFITAVGGNRLFHNDGDGKFSDITEQAGVGGDRETWSTSAAWIDYDNDGKLDLFVCNYVKWSPDLDLQVNYQLPGVGRAYGPPTSFEGSFPQLYHNNGNGRFTDVSARAGLQIKHPVSRLPLAKSLGVAPVDLDGDGYMDLIVANDTVQNFVFHNERNGTFKEIGGTSGIALDPFGTIRGAMGIDSGRFQADNSLGISIGNFANEMTALYVARRNPLLFADEAISQGIGNATRNALTFGVFFFDYDLDGYLDLLTVNGHIEPEIAKVRAGQEYLQSAQLFWNARSRKKQTFIAVPPEKCGRDLFKPIAGRGSAFADMDSDGDLDVVITQVNGAPILLRNDRPKNANFLRLKLVGTRSNPDAIGTWVRVRVGSETFSQQVMPTRSYLSQSELPVTFGLGNHTTSDDVTITWPGGGTQKVQPQPGKLVVVRQQ